MKSLLQRIQCHIKPIKDIIFLISLASAFLETGAHGSQVALTLELGSRESLDARCVMRRNMRGRGSGFQRHSYSLGFAVKCLWTVISESQRFRGKKMRSTKSQTLQYYQRNESFTSTNMCHRDIFDGTFMKRFRKLLLQNNSPYLNQTQWWTFKIQGMLVQLG